MRSFKRRESKVGSFLRGWRLSARVRCRRANSIGVARARVGRTSVQAARARIGVTPILLGGDCARDHKPAPISRLRGDSKPHLTSAAERLMVDRHERRRAARRAPRGARRGRASPSPSSWSPLALPLVFGADCRRRRRRSIALIVALALVSRVEFDVGAGYTIPTQILFVPVLFFVDPAWAPLDRRRRPRARPRAATSSRDHNPGRQVLVAGRQRVVRGRPGARPRRSAVNEPVVGRVADLRARAREPVPRRHGRRRRARVARARRPAARCSCA